MGAIPPPPPPRMIEITCLEDPAPVYLLIEGSDPVIVRRSDSPGFDWNEEARRLTRLDREAAATKRQAMIGAGLLIGFIVSVLLAGLHIAGVL